MKKTTQKIADEIIENNEAVTEKAPTISAEVLVGNEGKVGAILKQTRLRQGKRIPEISQSLCIRKAYLEAIEESNYNSLPEMPYGLGFIRSYADYLGEDSAQIVRMYKDETVAKYNNENKMYVLEPQTEATVPGKKALLISLLAILLVYLLWYSFNNYQSDTAAESDSAVSESIAVTDNQYPLVVEDYAPVEAPVAEVVAEVVEVAPVEEVNAPQVVVNEGNFNEPAAVVAPVVEAPAKVEATTPGKSNIVLKIKKETWVEVKDGKKLYISKVLQSGETYAIPKGNGMILSVGRFDGVDVLVGGQKVTVVTADRKTNISLDDAIQPASH